MNTQSFAITCWSSAPSKKAIRWMKNPSKIFSNARIFLYFDILFYLEERILHDIINEFGENIVQYICVATETGHASSKVHLHMQIILKRPVNNKSWFMDKYTGIVLIHKDSFVRFFLFM